MEREFSYYVIEPEITERTPLLMNDLSVDPEGISFLSDNQIIEEDYIAHLQFLMPLKNPDMNVDYLFLDTFAVFSSKVCDVLIDNHISIDNIQLIKTVISENNEEYNDFYIAYVHKLLETFDENLSDFDKKNDRGEWINIDQIVLDKKKLSQIPLKDRLCYEAKEYPAIKLYHESVVDIIKSVNPKGMRFIPIEEWEE